MIWIGAIIMGLSLGLLGSGGSILTVPLLVFVAHEPEKIAIAESLLIVGTVAAVGGIRTVFSGDAKASLIFWFGLPSMLGAYAGALASQYVSGEVQLAIFSLVMLMASYFMLRPASPVAQPIADTHPLRLIVSSLPIGALAGLVGVGGGFLIVPALMLIAKVSVRHAVGSSLWIIVFQSFAGFYKHFQLVSQGELSFNWPVILTVGSCAIAGVLIGGQVANKIPQKRIKQVFGLLLITLSLYTLRTIFI